MSLIQAALNKTALLQPHPQPRAQTQAQAQTQTRTVVEPKPMRLPRIWPSNLLDESLEKKLEAVQRQYNARRLVWWKIGAGVVLFLAAAVVFQYKGNFVQLFHKKPQSVVPAMVTPVYRLSGITDFGGKPRAIINGQIVAVGDLISKQAVVKNIGQGEVLIDAGGKEILLRI